MQRTVIDKSLKDFSFQIFYLNDPLDIEHISDPNFEDIIYAKCYPKWNISKQELNKSIEDNKSILLNKMKAISNDHDLFYYYFDIDFTSIKGITTKLIENRIYSIEVRPEINKKNIDARPKGFINGGELPPKK